MAKPKMTREVVEKILKANKLDFSKHPVILVGIRGYYLDSMGVKGENDRGIYDDAFFWVTKNSFVSFNGNTDPSRVKKGKGTGSKKGMANLVEGVWTYQQGKHNGSSPHMAFRQAAAVKVLRDGIDGNYEETGWFGINIHRGGQNGTSSLGCQTVPVAQWKAFKDHGYNTMNMLGVSTFPYLLISETNIRKGNLKV